MLGGPYLSGLPTLFHWTGTAAVASSVSDIPKAKQPAEHAAIAADARMEERGDMEERAACDGTRGGQAGQARSAVTHWPHRLCYANLPGLTPQGTQAGGFDADPPPPP